MPAAGNAKTADYFCQEDPRTKEIGTGFVETFFCAASGPPERKPVNVSGSCVRHIKLGGATIFFRSHGVEVSEEFRGRTLEPDAGRRATVAAVLPEHSSTMLNDAIS